MGHSWADATLSMRSAQGTVSATQALVAFATKMGLPVDASTLVEAVEDSQTVLTGASFATGLVTAEPKFYRTDSSIEQVYELIVPTANNYWNAFVSTVTGKVIAVNVFSILTI
jgi:hypothetical protein